MRVLTGESAAITRDHWPIDRRTTRRTGIRAGRLLILALSAMTALGATAGGAQARGATPGHLPALGAGPGGATAHATPGGRQARPTFATNGDHLGATINCNSYDHSFRHTPYALPADGLYSQTIWYRIWVYNLDTRMYQAPIPRNGYLSFTSAFNGGGAPARTVRPGPGRYMVATEYWWNTNGRWYKATDWTRWYWQDAWSTQIKDVCRV